MKIGTWILFTAIILATSCRNYEDTISYPSPDGNNIIDVTTELQLSNDPDPFWQHISLRSDSIYEPILPGNVYRLPFYEKPQVIWIKRDSVIVIFSGNVGMSFNRTDAKAKFINGIKVIAIIEDKNNTEHNGE
jgi:hypothetical protein